MAAITNFLSKNGWVTPALTLIFGLIIGLPVLGWGLFPVRWTTNDEPGAGPGDLTATFQRGYVLLVADSFALNQNIELARARLALLGDGTSDALNDALERTTQPADNLRLSALMAATGYSVTGSQAPGGGAAVAPLTTRILRVLLPVCGVAILVVLLGGAGFFILSRQSRAGGGRLPTLRPRAAPASSATEMPTVAPQRADGGRYREPPIAQFMTTYAAGDELYDDSFSIDGPTGDFLGECGVGISETIGVGDPKKVAALEVWLFDKNDIRTVTRVVMSEHTFRDDATRSKLSAKGEPVLAKAGDTLVLETATLRVTARVVDLAYGGGPLPPNSYFDRITIELAAWQKESQPAPAT